MFEFLKATRPHTQFEKYILPPHHTGSLLFALFPPLPQAPHHLLPYHIIHLVNLLLIVSFYPLELNVQQDTVFASI